MSDFVGKKKFDFFFKVTDLMHNYFNFWKTHPDQTKLLLSEKGGIGFSIIQNLNIRSFTHV
jgi:hypothetical protein